MTPKKSFPEAARSLGHLLRSPYESLSRRIYAELAKRGFPEIRFSHSSLLRTIAPDGSRLTDLAHQAGITKQSMAYIVSDLRDSGYLTHRPDPADGRAKLVCLTDRGEQLIATMLEISREIANEINRNCGNHFLENLKDQLAKLDEALS